MKFALQSTVLAALFFTVVFATPMKGRPAAPVAAQYKLPPSTVTCGTNTYSDTRIQDAIKKDHAHINMPIGDGNYPHDKNGEGLPWGPGVRRDLTTRYFSGGLLVGQ